MSFYSTRGIALFFFFFFFFLGIFVFPVFYFSGKYYVVVDLNLWSAIAPKKKKKKICILFLPVF